VAARRWRTAILCALGAIACTVTGLYWAGANGYLTRPIASWLSTWLGRALEVDGGLRIEIGRVTRITASDLRLGNPAWASRPEMVLVRKLSLELDTRSVFQNTTVVHKLNIEGLDLQFERNAAGENNWTFHLPRREPSGAIPLIVEVAALPGARIRFSGPRLERALDVTLDTAEQRVRANGTLDLTVRGVANDTPLELQASAGPLSNLVAAKEFSAQASGHLGEISLGITARVDSWEAPVDTEATVSLQAPSADYLATHLGMRSLPGGPVALEISISPQAAGNGVQGFVSGQIGEFAISAHGSASKQANTRTLAVQANVAGHDLSRLGNTLGLMGLPAEAFRLQVDAQRAGDVTRLSRVDLELADGHIVARGTLGAGGRLPGSDIQFSAATPDVARIERRLKVRPVLSGPVEMAGSLQHTKSGESTLQLNAITGAGAMTIQGPLGRPPKFYGTRFAVSVNGADFAPLGKALKLPMPPVGAYKGSGDIEWNRGGLMLRGVKLAAADETLKVDGSLGRPILAPGADLRLELSGASAARLGQRFGLAGLPAAGYRVAGRMQRQKGRTVLTGVKASTASAAVELDGALGDFPNMLATKLAFTAGGSAFEDFHGLIAKASWPRGRFAAAGELSVSDGMLHLRKVKAALAGAQGTFSTDVALPLNRAAMTFDFDATVPDLANLMPDMEIAAAAGKNLHVIATGSRLKDRWSMKHLRLESGADLLDTQGELVVAPRTRAKDVLLELRMASLRRPGLPGGQLWPDQPLALRARLSRSDTDMNLSEVAGRLGESDFAGTLAAHGLDGKPDFDLRLNFRQLDLTPYFNKNKPRPAAASGPKPNARTASQLLIPDEALPIPDLNRLSGKVALKAQQLEIRDQEFNDLNLQATLRGGRLQVEPLAVTGAGAHIDVRLDLTARGKGMSGQLSAAAKNLRLSPFLTSAGGADASSYSAQVDLKAAGGSLRELASTLTGRIRLVGSSGRVANSGLIAGSNDFFKQLLVSLNPVSTRQAMTDVVCVAYLFRAKDGVIATDPAVVMRTAEVDIVSNGTVDLRTEKIDFSFKTAARKGLGLGVTQLINPYIKVTGSLAKPGVALDPSGALVNGGAAFATAGLSIVATTLWDRVVHLKDPCAAAVADSDRRSGAQNATVTNSSGM
jgi:uncharacterized protein involved in outer membrane biogenesis